MRFGFASIAGKSLPRDKPSHGVVCHFRYLQYFIFIFVKLDVLVLNMFYWGIDLYLFASYLIVYKPDS